MLYAGLDLSRKRLDFHLLDGEGATVDVGASPPDADGLRGLRTRIKMKLAVASESMRTGTAFGLGTLHALGFRRSPIGEFQDVD
jgi:hypothetical protein